MATYGIDLGTTYSCIATTDSETGRPVILKSAVGEDTTPSVAYFESPGNVVVGRAAKDSALLAPGLVAELVKREMGRSDARYVFHGKEHTPETISALILRELARAAAEQVGEQVRDVVITVPAYFGVAEREATRNAGRIAGLNVLDVIDEPVAAALSYQALGGDSGVRHLFVYDLGGGTFDTSVIRVEGSDVTVVCTGGDSRLGGADWDERIISFLLAGFTSQYPQLDPSGDEQFMQDLAVSAEQLKRALSATMARKQTVRFDGSAVQLELTRDRLEEITSELLERTMDITGRTLATARDQGVDEYGDVLLVGGMTAMPVIARTLRERFGLAARVHEPHLAVAKGAALFALIRKVQASVPGNGPGASAEAVEEAANQTGLPVGRIRQIASTTVATVVPRAVGLKVTDHTDPMFKIDPGKAREYIAHLLTANTPLPADSGPQPFATTADGQRSVRLEVWEQAGSVASEELAHNTRIGHGMLTELPPRPAGAPFEVVFHLTAMGLLQVHAREADSRREVNFEIQIGGLGEKEVKQAAEEISVYDVSG